MALLKVGDIVRGADGIKEVIHDNTLVGKGTASAPLSAVTQSGDHKVATNDTDQHADYLDNKIEVAGSLGKEVSGEKLKLTGKSSVVEYDSSTLYQDIVDVLSRGQTPVLHDKDKYAALAEKSSDKYVFRSASAKGVDYWEVQSTQKSAGTSSYVQIVKWQQSLAETMFNSIEAALADGRYVVVQDDSADSSSTFASLVTKDATDRSKYIFSSLSFNESITPTTASLVEYKVEKKEDDTFGASKQEVQLGGSGADTYQAKINESDAAPGYLADKLLEGEGVHIQATESNQLRISADPPEASSLRIVVTPPLDVVSGTVYTAPAQTDQAGFKMHAFVIPDWLTLEKYPGTGALKSVIRFARAKDTAITISWLVFAVYKWNQADNTATLLALTEDGSTAYQQGVGLKTVNIEHLLNEDGQEVDSIDLDPDALYYICTICNANGNGAELAGVEKLEQPLNLSNPYAMCRKQNVPQSTTADLILQHHKTLDLSTFEAAQDRICLMLHR